MKSLNKARNIMQCYERHMMPQIWGSNPGEYIHSVTTKTTITEKHTQSLFTPFEVLELLCSLPSVVSHEFRQFSVSERRLTIVAWRAKDNLVPHTWKVTESIPEKSSDTFRPFYKPVDLYKQPVFVLCSKATFHWNADILTAHKSKMEIAHLIH